MGKLLDYIEAKHKKSSLSVSDAAKLLKSQQHLCDDKGICYAVTVKEVKLVFGNTVILVEPVAGYGSRWVRPTDLRRT